VNSGHPHRHFTRTDLFLVRIWTKGAEAIAGDNANISGEGEVEGEGGGKLEWRGTVQRAVDGEAHQFSSWQGLQDLLVAMISNNKGR
jgi:hypothetical protein